MSYVYNDGDGLTVFDKTTPDGSTEPVSNLDDAIKQIKAYMKDAVGGLTKLRADATTNTTNITALTTRVGTAETNITSLQQAVAALQTGPTAAIKFVAKITGSQTIAAGAGATLIQFNSTDVNPGTIFNVGTYKFTAPSAGLYSFFAAVGLTTSASAGQTGVEHKISLYVNSAEKYAQTIAADTSIQARQPSIGRLIQLAQGDIVDARYTLSVTGGTMSVATDTTPATTVFEGSRLSD